MSEWQDISTAPKDGTAIQVRIPGYGEDGVVAWSGGFVSYNDDTGWEDDVGAWVWVEETEPPACWTDGVCWARNEDDEPSVKPTHWRPIAP